MSRSRASLPRRLAFAWLLALALAARALVPSGWMPGADGRLVLCPGQAAMTMPMGGHHEHPAPDHPCAFAGIGLPADLAPSLPAVAPAPAVAMATVTPSVALRPGLGLAAPPPPSHAPPARA